MKKGFAVVVVILFLLGLGSLAPAQQSVKMVLATGGTAGTYYPFGGAMTKIWNSKIPGMNVTAQATGASAENVRLVNKKEAELAIVQSDTVDFAFNAKETFKEKLTKLNAIAVLYPEIIQLVAREESPIKSFADLKGKKVGVGAPGSGTEANFRQLLDIYGMKKEDVRAQYLSFAESAEQFKDKHIDAFIVVAGIPNAAIMDIGAMHKIKILSIPDDMTAKLTKKYPFLAPIKIPANTYKNITTEVKTVAVMAVLIINSEIKDDIGYNLTKALFENQADLASAHAKGKELSLQTAVRGVSIPFHPGAVKYYKEKGAMK
ncbi:MAG: transporter solute receptor, family [Deltaproteobacteria bacterium]|nr:transporter solute receptor, family [Deltaproteobacteria bacterium]